MPMPRKNRRGKQKKSEKKNAKSSIASSEVVMKHLVCVKSAVKKILLYIFYAVLLMCFFGIYKFIVTPDCECN